MELICGDDPAHWAALGFTVSDGGTVRLGAVTVCCDGAEGGLRGWVLQGSSSTDAAHEVAPAVHRNGALGVDHVVLLTDSRDRSAAALVDAGGDERRRADPPNVPVPMSFVRLGPAVIEVAEAGGPPRLWGLVAAVPDLEAVASRLGPELLGEVKDAVQPGRRIATVREAAGLGTALAFMTPRAGSV